MEVKKMYGFIIKDDRRYDYAQKFLEQNGFTIQNEINNQTNFILFPFKKNIDCKFYDEKFFGVLDKNILIFSGVENDYIKNMCQDKKLSYFPIMNSDYVAILNAVPTAEGIISYLIQNRIETIMNSKVLIIGYGRCGKIIAQKLSLLGAKVFVNTLNKSDYAIAFSNKLKPFYELNLADQSFDIIINTAPCKTIDDKNLQLLSEETLLIDITRDGFDLEIAQQKNSLSNRLLSIPSKFALRTAGEILGKYIYEKVIECLMERKLDSV